MTPQQQALNSDLPHTEEFKELKQKVIDLKDGQQEIKATLESEVKAQKSFEEYVQGEFKKGSDKFDKFDLRMDEIEDEMKRGLKDIVEAIKDDKLEKMTKQIEKLQTEKEDDKKLKKSFWMGVIKSALVAVVTLTIAYMFYKMGLTPPK